jgi:hypothetical protein
MFADASASTPETLEVATIGVVVIEKTSREGGGSCIISFVDGEAALAAEVDVEVLEESWRTLSRQKEVVPRIIELLLGGRHGGRRSSGADVCAWSASARSAGRDVERVRRACVLDFE